MDQKKNQIDDDNDICYISNEEEENTEIDTNETKVITEIDTNETKVITDTDTNDSYKNAIVNQSKHELIINNRKFIIKITLYSDDEIFIIATDNITKEKFGTSKKAKEVLEITATMPLTVTQLYGTLVSCLKNIQEGIEYDTILTGIFDSDNKLLTLTVDFKLSLWAGKPILKQFVITLKNIKQNDIHRMGSMMKQFFKIKEQITDQNYEIVKAYLNFNETKKLLEVSIKENQESNKNKQQSNKKKIKKLCNKLYDFENKQQKQFEEILKKIKQLEDKNTLSLETIPITTNNTEIVQPTPTNV